MKRESLFSSAILDPKTRKLQIDLAERISGASAADIGRIAMDPVATHAARIIGASCLRASTSGQLIYPQAIFPFEGTTDLIASGKWLSHGDAPRSTFLVYSLRSCSHPFPFRALQYNTVGSSSGPNSPSADASPHASTTANRRAAPDSKNQSLVERDASKHLARKTNYFKEASRFPDLDKKPIWRNKLLFTDASDKSLCGKASKFVNFAAVGEAGSDRRVRPVDLSVITSAANWNLNSVPTFLRRAVAYLKQLEGITVKLLTQSQHDGWTVPLSVVADLDGEIDPKLMIEDNTGKLRMRKAAVFSLKRESKGWLLVIIEHDLLHAAIYMTAEQHEEEIRASLLRATVDFINKDANKPLKPYFVEFII